MTTNPSPPDWRGLCEELLGALENEGHAHWPGGPDGDPLIEQARALLAQPEPEGVGPSDEELLEINDGAYCPGADEVNDEDDSSWQYTSDYIRWLDENGTPQEQASYAAKGLRAVFEAGRRWGRPAPAPAGDLIQAYQAGRRDAEADAQQAAKAAEKPSDKQLYDLSCEHEGEPVASMRAALARYGRPGPAPAGDSTLRDAAQLALTTLEGWSNYDQWVWPISAMEQAKRGTAEALSALKTALSHPPPAPAGEVAELVDALRADAECAEVEHYDLCDMTADQMRRAADLLERQAAPVPVAVSEGLPGSEDCDADGMCWRYWPPTLDRWATWNLSCGTGTETHWLPAHALPLPSEEVKP